MAYVLICRAVWSIWDCQLYFLKCIQETIHFLLYSFNKCIQYICVISEEFYAKWEQSTKFWLHEVFLSSNEKKWIKGTFDWALKFIRVQPMNFWFLSLLARLFSLLGFKVTSGDMQELYYILFLCVNHVFSWLHSLSLF